MAYGLQSSLHFYFPTPLKTKKKKWYWLNKKNKNPNPNQTDMKSIPADKPATGAYPACTVQTRVVKRAYAGLNRCCALGGAQTAFSHTAWAIISWLNKDPPMRRFGDVPPPNDQCENAEKTDVSCMGLTRVLQKNTKWDSCVTCEYFFLVHLANQKWNNPKHKFEEEAPGCAMICQIRGVFPGIM